MSKNDNKIETIRAALEPHGIFVRGIVARSDGDIEDWHFNSIVLLGNIGGSIWPHFSEWRASHSGIADPLDAWSEELISPVAAAVGGVAFYPSQKPWRPFQQWAMRAEGLEPSPLGILIHPEYGLWHGYRGAIGIEEKTSFEKIVSSHPCDDCADKPCLKTCPVGAISENGFGYKACRTHLGTPGGKQGCMVSGCMARNACPVGERFRYPDEQIRFHMQALQTL